MKDWRKLIGKNTRKTAQNGNAMIYILVAIGLFGALTLVLNRQNQLSDSEGIDEQLLEFQTTQVLNYATSAKSVVDQMTMSGSSIAQLNFDLPSAASFDTGPYIHKVFHPQGGGLNYTAANAEIFTGTGTNPGAGWYMGLFNNVEWTPSTGTDVILTAHQISQAVCAEINETITGSTTIPALAGSGLLEDYLIDDSLHAGTNADFTAVVCANCDGWPSLCVSNAAADQWSYYNLIEIR